LEQNGYGRIPFSLELEQLSQRLERLAYQPAVSGLLRQLNSLSGVRSGFGAAQYPSQSRALPKALGMHIVANSGHQTLHRIESSQAGFNAFAECPVQRYPEQGLTLGRWIAHPAGRGPSADERCLGLLVQSLSVHALSQTQEGVGIKRVSRYWVPAQDPLV
jgi:hypothetical protein